MLTGLGMRASTLETSDDRPALLWASLRMLFDSNKNFFLLLYLLHREIFVHFQVSKALVVAAEKIALKVRRFET